MSISSPVVMLDHVICVAELPAGQIHAVRAVRGMRALRSAHLALLMAGWALGTRTGSPRPSCRRRGRYQRAIARRGAGHGHREMHTTLAAGLDAPHGACL